MRELRPLEDAISRLERMFAMQRCVRVVAPLAEAYRLERRLGEAVATARDGVRDYPHNISIRVVLARALRDQGEDADAREAFREVVRLDPENMEALLFVESMPDPRWDSPLEHPTEPQTNGADPTEPDETAVHRSDSTGGAELAGVDDAFTQPTDARLNPDERSSEPVSLTSELAHLSDLFGPAHGNALDRDGGNELTGIATLTLAEIYARQGLPDKAVEVCQQILALRPDDNDAKRRLEEYERALSESR